MNERLVEPDPRAGVPGRDDLHLGSMPTPRLGRRLGRWFIIALLVQVGLSGAALLALQSPWRTQARLGSSNGIAVLAAEQLAGCLLHPSNPLAHKALDGIAAMEGVRFAMVLDAAGEVVLAGGDRDRLAVNGAGATPPAWMTKEGPESRVSPDGSTVFVEPIGKDSKHRLVLGLADTGAPRAMFDGAIAVGAGFVGAAAIMMPVGYLRLRRSTGSFQELLRAIRRLGKGIAPDPVALTGEDEFAYLGVAFNSMASNILAAQRELRSANSSLEVRVQQRTEELRLANESLEHNNTKLAEITSTALRFTDDVAHEFRTPLAVILEFASLMQDGLAGSVSDQQSQHLGFISDAARDLSRLIDDFLDTSRLRAGRLPVHRQRHSVDELVYSAWTVLEAKALGGNVRLRRDIPGDLPPVLADLDKARRIVINLVVNAIKFSGPDTEVLVEARAVRDGVRISVVDHGPGMAKADVDSLFGRFKQTATGLKGGHKGFGLGLSITSELVWMNLGAITVESELGRGSVFSFTLPAFDEASILRSYLARLRELPRSTRIRAARFQAPPGGMLPEDRLTEFVADLMLPRDLQLPSGDGTSVLLLGATESQVEWRQRLAAPGLPDHETAETQARPVVVELEDSWDPWEVSAELLAELARAPETEGMCRA